MISKALRLAATVLCLLSLLACVATGWLWWRSYRVADRALRAGRDRDVHIASARGRLSLMVSATNRPGPPAWALAAEPGPPSAPASGRRQWVVRGERFFVSTERPAGGLGPVQHTRGVVFVAGPPPAWPGPARPAMPMPVLRPLSSRPDLRFGNVAADDSFDLPAASAGPVRPEDLSLAPDWKADAAARSAEAPAPAAGASPLYPDGFALGGRDATQAPAGPRVGPTQPDGVLLGPGGGLVARGGRTGVGGPAAPTSGGAAPATDTSGAPVWSAPALGFVLQTYPSHPFDNWSAPHWLPVAATAVLPLAWLGLHGRRAWVRRRRTRRGLCLRCGYDLRGTPAGRCSECGAEVPEIPAKGAAA